MKMNRIVRPQQWYGNALPMRNVIKVLLVMLSPCLVAQERAPEDSIMTVMLDEIVVTATRGGGEMLLLPMAVSVVGVRDFFASRRTGLNDALWSMPGVLVQSRAGGQDVRLTVRGFGARGQGDRSNAATVRGIKILIDGFPETEPDGRTALDLLDLYTAQRIEAVRSNASTLFGNASGGVLNIETMPWRMSPSVETGHLIGSYGLRRNNVRVGTPLSNGQAFVSITNSAFDGFRRNSSSRSTHLSVALTTEIDATTKLKFSTVGAINRFEIPGPLTAAQYDADPTLANATYLARRERRFNRTARLGVQLLKEMGTEQSVEVLGYLTPKVLERSERGTYRDFNRLHGGGGLVYTWKTERTTFLHRVTAGVDGSSQDGTILFYNLLNGERGDSLRTNKREAATTYGAFAQVELMLHESLRLVLGGRFDRQMYSSQEFAAGARARERRDQLLLDHLTPKAALLYRYSPTHSVYLNFSGGVEAPAFNEVDPPPTLSNVSLNPFLKPMRSTTLEIGMKGVEQYSSSFAQLCSYSVAVYSISINDEIVPYNGGAWFFSAGSSRRYGIEFGGQLDLRDGWSIKSALTLLQAEYRRYENELGNFAGKSVPGIAPYFINTRVRYGTTSGFSAELALEQVGSYFADDANTAKVPAYTLLHASAGYGFWLGAFRINTLLGVNNLTDRRYVASAFINPSLATAGGGAPSPAFIEPGLPVNVYGSVDILVEL
jgi:iron complex outermembrane receptor protein